MTSLIAVKKCTSYSLPKVQWAIQECIKNINGFEELEKGDHVLLKPNLLMSASPDEGITTHPAVVEAIARILLEKNVKVMIGDSPGSPYTHLENLWEKTGMKTISKKLGVRLLNFESTGSYIKKFKSEEYPIAKPILECDFIVNIPKIKTHNLTILTCAVKNMYGAIPGARKTDYHRRYPSPSEFSEKIVDIYELTQPNLTIVDGIIGMEGNGPSGGNPRKLGIILASNDTVALDVYISHILGMDPYMIPSNRIAIERGLGKGLVDIEIIGDEPPLIDDFKWPSNIYHALEFLPTSLARTLLRFWWSRPAIDDRRCENCGVCVEACPTGALEDGILSPVFDYEKCVNCLCCMEVCPHHAFFHEKSFLYRLTSRLSNKR
ncbi:MAG TPA: DUF362 domain-containing protein [Methanobacteriales archaeon]|nr:MAG: Uncharacterized protein XD44_0604 [Methanobacteriaceae archaeon 41_258]MBC7090053.1 DUF362 domain-containing protein [Methanobacteriaceae archaeon]HIH61771.1 DUF362 domain-containing protein [Methanobacteriales archaeon]